MTAVRERNESAWLLPNDGTRTNHRLRDDMRRFADSDEVDLVVVGCGACGATLLQRLARRGWRVVGVDAGPFWDPDADWVSDEAGSHHLYWTEPRVITGADPVPLGSNNSGRGVGGSMVHYAGTPRDCTPVTSKHRPGTGSAPTGHSATPTCARTTATSRTSCRGRRALALGRPALLPAPPAPGRRQRRDLPARRPRSRHHRQGRARCHRQRAVRQPPALHLSRLLPAGCKVNAKASPLITHIPDALAQGAEVRPDSMVTSIEVYERTGQATGVHYVRAGVPRFQRAAPWPWPLLDRDPAAAAELRLPAVPRRAVQRFRPGRAVPDGPGRAADRRAIRRRGTDVQGPATRGQLRGVLRDRSRPALPARLLDPERVTIADHLGRARCRAGPLGRGPAPLPERLRALGLPRGAM